MRGAIEVPPLSTWLKPSVMMIFHSFWWIEEPPLLPPSLCLPRHFSCCNHKPVLNHIFFFFVILTEHWQVLRATCYSLILNSIIWSLPWESRGHECIASKLYIVPHNTHQSVAEPFVVSQKHQALVLKSTKFLLAIFPLQTFLKTLLSHNFYSSSIRSAIFSLKAGSDLSFVDNRARLLLWLILPLRVSSVWSGQWMGLTVEGLMREPKLILGMGRLVVDL